MSESVVEKPERLVPDDLKVKGVLVVTHDGSCKGRTTGDHRACRAEGCTGREVKVKWQKGRPTWVCTKAVEYLKRQVKLVE